MERKGGRSAALGVLLVILLICSAASLAVLFGRLRAFNEKGFENIIELTGANASADVRISGADASPQKPAGNTAVASQADSSQKADSSSAQMQGRPSFVTYDENTVWSTQTDVEIFKLTYDETGKVTVIANEGNDKLLAPGTANDYTFTLENNGDVPLDYTMYMQAWFGSEYIIPVKARVSDHNGNYLLGSPAQTEDVLQLNSVGDRGVLGAGRCAVYTLDWEWVFEQGIDEYDTMLGNLAVDEDITLTIRIVTAAVYDDDPAGNDQGLPNPGGPFDEVFNPQTGELTPTGITALVLAGVMLISVVSLFIYKRDDGEEENEA